jgi:PTH1 family peptidyl-tRNA hydrolase
MDLIIIVLSAIFVFASNSTNTEISFYKSSGGHRGLESVIKAVKTREFTRIRIGIAPTTPSGKVKKPTGEQKVLDFILGKFKPTEQETLKKVFKTVEKIVETIVTSGRDAAMNEFNS